MEYIYGALLLNKLGKEVNEKNLKKIIQATGIDVDESKIKSLLTSLEGVDISKELETSNFIPQTSAPVKEKKKEEKPKEEKKELAAEGLAALFG